MRVPPTIFAFTTFDGVFQVWSYSRYRRGLPFKLVAVCIAYDKGDFTSESKALRKEYGFGKLPLGMGVNLDHYLAKLYFETIDITDFPTNITAKVHTDDPIKEWVSENYDLKKAMNALKVSELVR